MPTFEYERLALKRGFTRIAGVDEAGRGPLAGPVVAAACILPTGFALDGVNDSKKLTPKVRRLLFDQLTQNKNIIYGVGIVSHEVIDSINILQATVRAMQIAIDQVAPDIALVDGRPIPHPSVPIESIIKGDSISLSIAAASIIAKETRDRIMEEYHEQYPQYGFVQHKGYGTRAHIAALHTHGPSPIHRTSFSYKLP